MAQADPPARGLCMAAGRRRPPRRQRAATCCLAAVFAVTAPAGILAVATSASARVRTLPPACSQVLNVVTCGYGPVAAEQVFAVPPGVLTVRVTATGAFGAPAVTSAGSDGGGGAEPAQVTGTLTVAGHSELYVEVGGTPTSASGECFQGAYIDDCVGGWNGGGTGGWFGGGGGGASDVRIASGPGGSTSLDSRLIVAAGGGGGGATVGCLPSGNALGDNGGAAGADGLPGSLCPGSLLAGDGGGTPVQGQAGTGGAIHASAGTGPVTPSGGPGGLGTGGSAVNSADAGDGGGGGGGELGGGAGADGMAGDFAGSGGGGGSSLVPPGGSLRLAPDDPSVTISYTVPPRRLADLDVRLTGPGSAAAGSRFTEVITVTDHGPAGAPGTRTVLTLSRWLTVLSAPGAVRSAGGRALTWTAVQLDAGGTRAYLVMIRASGAIRSSPTLRASVAAPGSVDPFGRDDTATAAVRIRGSARSQ